MKVAAGIFKSTKMALEALRGELTLAQLGARYNFRSASDDDLDLAEAGNGRVASVFSGKRRWM